MYIHLDVMVCMYHKLIIVFTIFKKHLVMPRAKFEINILKVNTIDLHHDETCPVLLNNGVVQTLMASIARY